MDSARWRTARLLLLVCGAALLAILVWRNDPEAILHSIRQLGWRILIVIAFPFTLVNVFDTLGWRFAFRSDRDPRVSKRSEEHTSELQSRLHLVCRLLLEKKKNTN